MDNYERIIRELLDRTRKREITWAQTDLRNQYTIKLGDGKIKIDYNEPSSYSLADSKLYEIRFYNAAGDQIACFGSSEYGTAPYRLYRDLWEAILDAVYNRPETLSSMLKELGMEG